MSAKTALQAARAFKRWEFWRETHTSLWLLIDVSFFSYVKKRRSRFLLVVAFFSSVNTIVRSSDWLEPFAYENLRHRFLVSFSQYVYNKCQFALKVLNFSGIIRHN